MLYGKIILEILSLCIEPKKLLSHITFIIYFKILMLFDPVPKKNTQISISLAKKAKKEVENVTEKTKNVKKAVQEANRLFPQSQSKRQTRNIKSYIERVITKII